MTYTMCGVFIAQTGASDTPRGFQSKYEGGAWAAAGGLQKCDLISLAMLQKVRTPSPRLSAHGAASRSSGCEREVRLRQGYGGQPPRAKGVEAGEPNSRQLEPIVRMVERATAAQGGLRSGHEWLANPQSRSPGQRPPQFPYMEA